MNRALCIIGANLFGGAATVLRVLILGRLIVSRHGFGFIALQEQRRTMPRCLRAPGRSSHHESRSNHSATTPG
jgi:hypothetical protein